MCRWQSCFSPLGIHVQFLVSAITGGYYFLMTFLSSLHHWSPEPPSLCCAKTNTRRSIKSTCRQKFMIGQPLGFACKQIYFKCSWKMEWSDNFPWVPKNWNFMHTEYFFKVHRKYVLWKHWILKVLFQCFFLKQCTNVWRMDFERSIGTVPRRQLLFPPFCLPNPLFPSILSPY